MARRWSILNQVLWPFLGILLVAQLALVWVTVQLAAASKRREIDGRIAAVAQTLEQSRFPLTERVLVQMKGLSGADYAIADHRGTILVTTDRALPLPPQVELMNGDPLRLSWGTAVGAADRSYYIASLALPPNDRGAQQLLIYFPTAEFERQRWEVVRPIVILGGLAMLIVAGVAAVVAMRIARPIRRFKAHVERLVDVRGELLTVPARRDELRDLAISFNQMVERLRAYEATLRQTEQMRLLGLIRGGIAHHLRNAMMGARIALEVFQSRHQSQARDESLEVVGRQLTLMERYLKQFLELSPNRAPRREAVRLSELIEHVVGLVRPNAEHAGARLTVELADGDRTLEADREGLEQLLLNLLINAIEAAAAGACQSTSPREAQVRLTVFRAPRDAVGMVVEDNGEGPADGVRENLFAPFVTAKQDGIGLGLSVAQQVVGDHGGSLRWERRNGWTRFDVLLPATIPLDPITETS